jgi:hypothetical protein
VDTFWHLASGRWILSHGKIPREDPFRFTSDGYPWVDHEWLFQVVLAALERVLGLGSLVPGRALFLVALALVVAWSFRRSGTPPAVAAILVGAVILGVRSRLFLRPELVTMAGLALLLSLLQGYRKTGGSWVTTGSLVATVVVWANAHPGVITAPLVAGAFLVGSRLPGGSGPAGLLPWRSIMAVPLILALSMLINPYGAEILLASGKILAAFEGLDATNPDWSNAWEAPRPFFFVVLVALVVFLLVGKRRGARLDPATGLVFLLLLPLGLAGVRHQPLVVVSGAFLAAELAASWPRADPGKGGNGRTVTVLALGFSALVALWCVWSPTTGPLRPRGASPRFGFGLQAGLQPVSAVDRVQEMPGLGNLYNDVAFGGYLLWRLFPPRQVFIESRNEVNPGLLHEVEAARRDSRLWQSLVERYAIDGALVRYNERQIPVFSLTVHGQPAAAPEYHTSSALLFPREVFALLFWDDSSMLFVRRSKAREALLAEQAYESVQPEDWQAMLTRAAGDMGFRQEVREELVRRIREQPASRRAESLLEAVQALPEVE